MRSIFRFRPERESKPIVTHNRLPSTLEIDTDSNTVIISRGNGQDLEFNANALFGPKTNQKQLFESVGERIIDNVLEGYNASVFCYGQTGSGKTHTIFGTDNDEGLSFRCFKYLFSQLNSKDNDLKSWECSISALEVYDDKIYDRLRQQNASSTNAPLKIIHKHVANLQSVAVETYTNVKENLYYAVSQRQTASTNMNDTSSRSHLVIILNIRQQLNSGVSLISKLNFIDLAGSERVGKTGVDGIRLQEAKNINASLSALGRVVDALILKAKYKGKQKNIHVPYRDCTLTRILENSLGGNSMTTIIGCCATDDWNLDETASTLHFIARSRQITNKPRINQKFDPKQMKLMQESHEKYKIEAEKLIQMQKENFEAIIAKLTKENESLREELSKALGVQSIADDEMNKRLEEINALKTQIQEGKEKLSRRSENGLDMLDMKKLGFKFKRAMFLDSAHKGDIIAVEKLISTGLDINVCDSNGEGALAFAIKSNQEDMLKWLLENGANPNIIDKDCISPLMVSVVYDRIKCCKMLIEYGSNVDYENGLGCNAIHIGCSRGYTEIIKVLIRKTQNVNSTSKRGWSYLMFASKSGHVGIVKLLLSEQGININCVNKASCTALILACYSGHAEVVNVLMENGANHRIKDKFGMSAHIWATKKRYKDIVKILEQYGSKLSIKEKFQTF